MRRKKTLATLCMMNAFVVGLMIEINKISDKLRRLLRTRCGFASHLFFHRNHRKKHLFERYRNLCCPLIRPMLNYFLLTCQVGVCCIVCVVSMCVDV
jgi:hypothetical protein